MHEFTIDDLKRALVEVHELCKNITQCSKCPFDYECSLICNDPPCTWPLDGALMDGKEDDNG